MTSLATIADLEARLGRSLESDEIDRAQALLDDASAAFRRAARQNISTATSTIRVAPCGGRLLLPQHPVTAVSSVVNAAGDSVTFTWYDGWDTVVVASSLLLNSWEIEPFTFSSPTVPVTVTYTHGYTTIPDDVVGVVAQMALRAFGVSPDGATVTSETLGAYSVSYAAAQTAGAFGMLDSELAVALAYRRPKAPISVL